MITVTVGVLITVVLLVGFGFLNRLGRDGSSNPGNHTRPRPHPTRTTDIARQQGIRLVSVPGTICQ